MQAKTIFTNLYTSKYFANLPEFQKKRTQALLTLTLTIVTLSLFGIFAITPTVSTIANLQKQKDDNTFVEEKLDQKKANLGALSQAFSAIEPDLSYVYEALPKNSNVPTLTGQLYSLAKSRNITITRIQSSDIELTKTQEGIQQFSSFSFSVEALGSYNDLKQYINSLTNFERIITITSLSLTKEDGGIIKMNLQAKAYYKL